MSTTETYNRGIPTKPDIDRMRKAFGVPSIGQVIQYVEIEQVLNIPKKDNRFKTVVTAWRNAIFTEDNCYTEAERGVGIVARNTNERLQSSCKVVKSGFKSIGKGVRLAERTDVSEASPETKAKRTHIMDIGARVRLAYVTQPKEIELPALK